MSDPLSAKSSGTYLNSCDPLGDKYLFYYAYMHLLFLSGPALELKSSTSRSQVYALNVHIYFCLSPTFFPAFVLAKEYAKQKQGEMVVFSVSTDLGARTSHKVQFGIPRLCLCKQSEHIFHSKDSFLASPLVLSLVT